MKKLVSFLLVTVMCACLVAGCGSKSSDSDSAKDEGTDSKGTIVYISKDMNDSFGAWLANSMVAAGEKAGYKVTVMDCQGDSAKGVEMLENAQNSSPDAIIYQPSAEAQVLNTIKNIEESGIPVVVVNLPLPEDPDAVPTVVCDDYTLGYKIAEQAASTLPENANVVFINGITGLSVSVERRNGFEDGLLAKRDDVTLLAELDCNYNKDEAMNAMEDWLQKYDNIDGVVCQSDGMALGAIEAYKSAAEDYSNVPFFGIDGLADGCLSIKAGEETASVLQNANTMAEEAVKMVEGLKDGSITDCPTVSIDATVITSENVDDMIEMHKSNGLID